MSNRNWMVAPTWKTRKKRKLTTVPKLLKRASSAGRPRYYTNRYPFGLPAIRMWQNRKAELMRPDGTKFTTRVDRVPDYVVT